MTELQELTGQVAAELGQLRNEDWTPGTPTNGYAEDLTHGHASLAVELYDGRAYVRVNYPQGTGGEAFRITVSASRGPAIIAREISRRILDAGYTVQLARAVERKADQDAREQRRAELMTRAAALFAGEAIHEDGKVYLGKYIKGSGFAEPYYSEADGPALNLDLSGIPAETALAMLKVLADSRGARARCCHLYGAHHDARLSLIGCVRGQHTEAAGLGSLEQDALYDLYCKQSQHGPQPGSWEEFERAGLEPACCVADKYHDPILTGPGCLQKRAG